MKYLDFSKIYDVKYILAQQPSYEMKFLVPMLVVYTVFLIFGALSFILFKKKDKVYSYFYNELLKYFFVIGSVGLLFLFFRLEELPFLSMRLWFLVIGIVAIIWGIKILIYRLIILPKEIASLSKFKEFKKYLPRKKGK
jgi:hypothetical protein